MAGLGILELFIALADAVKGLYERENFLSELIFVPARVVVLIEVEGAGDWFPAYAGTLDIMTASAIRVGEAMATADRKALA